MKQRKQPRKHRLPLWKFYFQGVFFAGVGLLLAAGILMGSWNPPKQAVEPVTDLETPKDLQAVLLLGDGFDSDQLLGVALCDYQGKNHLITLTFLPGNSLLGGSSIQERFSEGEGSAVLQQINQALSLDFSVFFTFSPNDLYQLSQIYGTMLYRLEQEISYYDPKTGESFHASVGLNRATGLDFCKLSSLALRQNVSEGANLTASRMGNYLLSHLRHREWSQWDFEQLVTHSKNNLSRTQYDQIAPTLFHALTQGELKLVPVLGEESKGQFQLSPSVLTQLAEDYSFNGK